MADAHGCRADAVGRYVEDFHLDTLSRLFIVMQQTVAEWLRVRWTDLHFAEGDTAMFLLISGLVLLLTTRFARGRRG